MIEQILKYLEKAGGAISLFAVAVIILGFAIAAWRYVSRFSGETHENNFNRFKVELGSSLLLGIEILVFADVIETITVALTFLSVAFLAIIVVIRTAMSWTLTLQTTGHWPWQASSRDQKNA